MNVKLIAHTQLSSEFFQSLSDVLQDEYIFHNRLNDSQAVALSAIRTCYSPNKPSEIIKLEGEKYFNSKASDGKEGTDADRLLRHIVNSGHTSTLEHITYTFAVEGVSRSLLAQLTRHRQFSFSVQSQRYVRFGSKDKSGGFDYVLPPTLEGKNTDSQRLRGFDEETGVSKFSPITATEEFEDAMKTLQSVYDRLRKAGVPAEDARFVLPNAATCNLVMSGNLRAILEFYTKRKKGNGSQWEIADFSEKVKEEVLKVDEWVKPFFD